MKLSSLRLANEYMKRITGELQSNECTREENLLLQGVRFAYRIHQVNNISLRIQILFSVPQCLKANTKETFQFAGGFDGETIRAFQDLKRVGLSTM